jgi:gamma-glutamyltranspeptidase / glutathione hydrolase
MMAGIKHKPPVEFQTGRAPVSGKYGMTASSQVFASQAGVEILKSGGNAADAAVAMAAALNVTEPTSTGLGGDCFSLYFQSSTHSVFAMNGSGRAPAGLSLERLNQEGFNESLPPFHPYTITVPGACAGWCDLVERFGKLSLSQILSPAIRLAEEGFTVAPITAWFWQRAAGRQLTQALNGRELTIEGRGPQAGEMFHNLGLAKTLQTIASGGKKAYYEGAIAESIASIVQEAGGCMTTADLAAHQSTWEDPISTLYRGIRIWECPPNGQGLVALLALNLLSQFDVKDMPALSPERLHILIETLRIAFADGLHFIADPLFQPAPLDDLLSVRYTEERRTLLQPDRVAEHFTYGDLRPGKDTVYFCVVDGEGNACSFINSNYMGFGTGIVPRGWGFSLQNRGHNFSLKPQHPNRLEPGKRPYHTIIPGMATWEKTGALYAPFGVMGGFMQPQGHVQALMALLDDGLDPQAALERPRIFVDAEQPSQFIALEEGIPDETLDTLKLMGHRVSLVSGMERAMFGRGQIILRNPETGELTGGSDPRADGCALGVE